MFLLLDVAVWSLELTEDLVRVGGLALGPSSDLGSELIWSLAADQWLLFRNL
jgi:hypothetical protein